MYSSKYKLAKKIAVPVIIFFFIFQLFNPSLLTMKPAYAFADTETGEAAGLTNDVAGKVKDTTKEVTKEVKETVMDRIFKGLILSASISLRNALVYMSSKMAEQTVDWMATGEWGQGAMFYEQAWGQFTNDIVGETLGVFLDNLSAEIWAETGFDICDPALPSDKINIMIGLELPNVPAHPGYLVGPEPDCTLSKLTNNWEAFGENIESKYNKFIDDPGSMSLAYLQEAGTISFDPKYAEVGVMLKLDSEIKKEQAARQAAEEKQRAEGDGQKAKTSMSGEFVNSPAYMGKKKVEKEIEDVKDMPKSEMEASKEVITEIPESMVAAFLNSFVSQAFSELIMKKLFEDGLTNTAESYKPRQYVFEPGKQLEKEIKQVSTVSKVSYSVNSKQIDLLTQFTTCPQDRQLYNCVVDGDFAQAVRAADQDTPLSLREAIESGKINGNLPLIPPSNALNNDATCYEKGWCYSNLVKLRMARIVPIGWELAALEVGEEEKDSTLKKAMDNFDVQGKFYHLVDPDWILRAPKARCEAEVPGPILIGAGADARDETCSDLQSCLDEDESGKCKAWGYCAAEKNVFRFGGQDCGGQYDSCRVLTSRKGEEVKYLLNTVDKTGCDPNSVGCKWYSLAMDGPPLKWVEDDNNKIFLNKSIDDFECNPGAEGCTRFIKTSAGLGTNLVPNGSFDRFEGEVDEDSSNENIVAGWYNNTSANTSAFDLLSDSGSGSVSLRLHEEEAFSEKINITPKSYTRYFAVSLQGKKVNDGASIEVSWYPVSGESVSGDSSGFVVDSKLLNNADVDSWESVYSIFAVKADFSSGEAYVGGNYRLRIAANDGTILVDNILFEEIDSPAVSSMHQYTDYALKNAEYVKQAPEYLACYNVDDTQDDVTGYGRPLMDSVILADDDVAKSVTTKGCDGFAKLCNAEEVGCEKYTVTDGSRAVNGVVSFNDYCPQQCNGYATFSQSSTYFTDGLFPEYLIPSTATQCSSAEVGCEEFTNLDEISEGAEAKEYFSELRMCEQLPENKNNCANFYTWVAEEVTGYQLKTYYLKKNGDGNPDVVGVEDVVACNKDVFDTQQNPDCRAFYNDAGQVSYRLYSQTITCSTDCHPYRRTLEYLDIDGGMTGEAQCQSRQGEWVNGECLFMAIPSEGKTCTAVNAGCKEYKGNYSGDEEVILQAAFTSTDLEMFETVSGSIVTLAEGQVLDTRTVQPIPDEFSLASGEYLFSFWARSDSGFSVSIGPYTGDSQDNQIDLVSTLVMNDEWKFFTYNFSVSEAAANSPFQVHLKSLISVANTTLKFYVDNFQVKKVSDANYLIQNSWNTPDVCDYSLLNDETLLPQAQVGCREYQDRAGTIHYLKTFSGLCSGDKIGCEALIDTKNNIDPFEKEYEQIVDPEVMCSNMVLVVEDELESNPSIFGSGFTSDSKATGVTAVVGVSCNIEVEKTVGVIETVSYSLENSCLSLNNVNSNAVSGQEYFWDGIADACKVKTSIIPADNTIYLVNNEAAQCEKSEKGCMAVGLPAFDGAAVDPDAWETYFYRLDPELFGGLNSPLCQSSAQSCEEYKDEKGATYFFKDPQGKVCEWKYGTVADEPKEAWFEKGKDATNENVCGGTDYAVDYFGDGIDQLRHFDKPGYAGWVGACPDSENKCTAFIDPTDDIDDDGVGKAYYYINNEQIEKTCTGVSRKDGCILFDDTSNPTLKYDSDATYQASLTPLPEHSVSATVADPEEDADSNSIIKVVRDRECAAWYDCLNGHWAWDPNLNKYQEVCDNVGVCTRLTSESDSPRCASFIIAPTDSNILTINEPLKNNYKSRNTNWEDYDYSGLAIPMSAPIHLYNAFDVSDDKDDPEFHLVNYEFRLSGQDACTEDSECEVFCEVEKTIAGVPLDKLDPTETKFKESCRCLSGTCVRGNPELVQSFDQAESPGCRAYPSVDAPFPAITEGAQAYKNARKVTYKYSFMNGDSLDDKVLASEMKLAGDYGCFYSQRSYGGGAITKYFPLDFESSAEGLGGISNGFCQENTDISCVCVGEPAGLTGVPPNQEVIIKTNTVCSSLDCGRDSQTGLCMIQSEKDATVDKYYGWQGYCLERDRSITINNTQGSHPCLTWFPTDSLAGLQDIKNNYEEAGYNPSADSGNLFTIDAMGLNRDFGYGGLVDGCAVTGGVCDCNTPDEIESLEACYKAPESATVTPYLKIVNSLSCSDDGPSKNWLMCLPTSTGDARYAEMYHGAVPETIYENEIIGIVLKGLKGHHSDMAFGTAATAWEAISAPEKDLDNVPGIDGYYISKKTADHFGNFVGPVWGKPAQSEGDPFNYVTTEGTLNNYRFYKEDGTLLNSSKQVKDYFDKDYKNWTYWQVVWPGAATNTSNAADATTAPGQGEAKQQNRFLFGGYKNGTEYLLTKDYLWDHYENSAVSDEDQVYLAPLFMMNGWDNRDEDNCRNTLTKSLIPNSLCEDGSISDADPLEYTKSAYKKADGDFDPVGCSSSNCPKGADLLAGYDGDAQGICVETPDSSKYCSNVQCDKNNNESSDSGLVTKITNSDCEDGWWCGDGETEAGTDWCGFDKPVSADGPDAEGSNGGWPLNGYCDVGWGDGDPGDPENYWGIRIMFDEKGKYSGVWFSICDDSGGWGAQKLEIQFLMNEYSEEIVQVNKNDITNENKAFTNKIYQKFRDESSLKSTGVGQIYYNSKDEPIGSAAGSSLDTTKGIMRMIPDTKNVDSAATDNQQPGGSTFSRLSGAANADHSGGKPWGCEAGSTQQCASGQDEFDENAVDASKYDVLTNYFAKIYTGWWWDRAAGTYKVGSSYAVDLSSSGASPPIVAAVMPTGKTDNEGNQIYAAVPGKITVNGKTDTDIVATDGNMEASLKFYAWADDDQMPITSISVNWGTGATYVPPVGKYKNHKPRCQRSEMEELGWCESTVYSTKGPFDPNGVVYGYACDHDFACEHLPGDSTDCDNFGDRFGDITAADMTGMGLISACEEAYYHFNNFYQCNQATLDGLGTCGSDKDTPCKDTYNGKEVCRYLPKVQVRDNWGWCNGNTEWNEDGKIITETPGMSAGSQNCGQTNKYEFYDAYIYIAP